VAAILFGVAYILVVIKRPPSWGPILTYTLVLSAVVAAAVYLGLCPIPPKDGVAR
jgi:cytosine/uracil/thiamine/allantoin permease